MSYLKQLDDIIEFRQRDDEEEGSWVEPTLGTVGGIAGLGALGYGAYKLFGKRKPKFPALPESRPVLALPPPPHDPTYGQYMDDFKPRPPRSPGGKKLSLRGIRSVARRLTRGRSRLVGLSSKDYITQLNSVLDDAILMAASKASNYYEVK